MSTTAQFLHSFTSKFFNDAFAARRERYENNPVICPTMGAAEQAHSGEAIDALDCGVVPHKKSRGEMLDRGAIALWHAADCKQELKLLRFQPSRPCGFVAIRHKKANLVAELREGPIIAFRRIRSHLLKVYR